MSQYYRDLHDRELLTQAESILTELHRRRLLDVRVPDGVEANGNELVRCPVDGVIRNGSVLSILVDRKFEPISWVFPSPKAASGSE
jgi:hypothetical protein